MIFKSDRRPDLSGVPESMQPGRARPPSAPDDRPPSAAAAPQTAVPSGSGSAFWSLVRVAVWLCVALAIGFAMAFMGIDHPLHPVQSDEASQQTVIVNQAGQEAQARWAQETLESAKRDSAAISAKANLQHDQAMDAVEKARALAKNPDSAEARAAFDKAMRDVQAMSEEMNRADRDDWMAEDYGRALKEGRSITR